MPRRFSYSEAELREAVAASVSFAEVLRRLGLRTAGGNHATVRKYVDDVHGIPTPAEPIAPTTTAAREARATVGAELT